MTGLAVLVLLVSGAACSGGGDAGTSTQRCDPPAFRAIQAARASRTEVTLCGTVVSAGRVRRTRSGTHRTFFVDAGNNDRVEVDANLDIMGYVPVRRGEAAVVHGEFYADPGGRDGVHWTHRTLRGNHPPGYVILDGVLYH